MGVEGDCCSGGISSKYAYLALAGGLVGGLAIGYLIAKKTTPVLINQRDDIKTNFHAFDIEDIADRKSFCRCWKSKQFPFCDGTHHQWVKDTGDNVGPVLIKHKNKE